MRPVRSFLICSVGLSALALPGIQAVDLRWQPRIGDTLDYRMVVRFAVQDFKFNYESNLALKVTDVRQAGDYDVESVTRNVRLTFNDNEEFVPEEEKPIVATVAASGERISDSRPKEEDAESDPTNKLLFEVFQFVPPPRPMAVGGKWTRRVKADPNTKSIAANYSYEFVNQTGDPDSGKIELKYGYRQTSAKKPVVARGTIILRRRDYTVDSVDIEATDFQMDKDAPEGKATLLLRRQ